MAASHNVARTFDFEWKAHHEGRFEQSTLWGRTPSETWDDFLSRMMIPRRESTARSRSMPGADPGNSRARSAEHGAALAIGLDISDAVEEASESRRDLPNVQIVQGSVLAPPFKPASCSSWSGAPASCTAPLMRRRGHDALSRVVKPGGVIVRVRVRDALQSVPIPYDVLDACG